TLAGPVIALVLGLTATPGQLRFPDFTSPIRFDFELNPLDILANLVMYVPIGALLARRTVTSTLGVAALMSSAAEFSQLFTVGRAPAVVDILTNVAGACVGRSLCRAWPFPS